MFQLLFEAGVLLVELLFQLLFEDVLLDDVDPLLMYGLDLLDEFFPRLLYVGTVTEEDVLQLPTLDGPLFLELRLLRDELRV